MIFNVIPLVLTSNSVVAYVFLLTFVALLLKMFLGR